jgi:Fe-S cluster biosynthesis and repair protein YggX
MADITCRRCGETRAAIPYRPFPTELGARLLGEICNVCWGEWLQLQQQLINHYGLNVREPSAKEFLTDQLEQFLFTNAPQS